MSSINISTPTLFADTNDNWCLKPDEYRKGIFLIGSICAVFEFNLTTRNSTLIAGQYAYSGYIEGVGPEARFSDGVYDLVQIDRDSFIVADGGNNCLRWLNSSRTYPLAGRCTFYGFEDGTFTEAKFSHSRGLLYLRSENFLFLADLNNNAVRLLNMMTQLVSTVIRGDLVPVTFPRPVYLACFPPCTDIYITFFSGVTLYNRVSNTTRLIAGGLESGNATGSFQETRMTNPTALTLLSPKFLIVSDNNRVLDLDLSRRESQVAVNKKVWSVLCYNDTLFFGDYGGIWLSQIINPPRDLICYDPDNGYATVSPTPTATSTTPTTTSTDILTGSTNASIITPATPIAMTTRQQPTPTRSQSDQGSTKRPDQSSLTRDIIIACTTLGGLGIVALDVSITIIKMRKASYAIQEEQVAIRHMQPKQSIISVPECQYNEPIPFFQRDDNSYNTNDETLSQVEVENPYMDMSGGRETVHFRESSMKEVWGDNGADSTYSYMLSWPEDTKDSCQLQHHMESLCTG